MIDTTSVRAKILASIGARSTGPGALHAREYAGIPRDYSRTHTLHAEARLELFAERLREYDAGVHFVVEAEIADQIAILLASRQKHRMLAPVDLPRQWIPNAISFTPGDGLTPRELDAYDGVLTACTVAIALTGTIVLQNAAGQGPRALSLVPDYHLCVVFAGQVVETVPEAFDLLKATAHLPTTFISGPSATADIEMTRIKGVHGPRFLDVLVVNG